MAAAGSGMEKWLESKLTGILGFDSSEIVNYILTISCNEERESYLREMLDTDNSEHNQFLNEFSSRSGHKPGKKSQLDSNPNSASQSRNSSRSNKSKSNSPAPKQVSYPPPGFHASSLNAQVSNSSSKNVGISSSSSSVENAASKKKTKYVNLYASDGQTTKAEVVMLKGRHPCDCLATKHALVNNCTRCGKIVCAQEGPGPCLFCKALVATKQQQEVLDRGSKKSEQLRKQLLNDAAKYEESQAKAEAQKERLLEYDRTSEKRTKVIDDESDYFSVDAYKWMTEDQRKAFKAKEDQMRAKKHASRLDRKLNFDFAGRRIVETKENELEEDFDEAKLLASTAKGNVSKGDAEALLHPYLKVARPTLVENQNWLQSVATNKSNSQEKSTGGSSSRLQDKELQEMCDQGMCLSMHQPWASYLVAGVKQHEGRTWYSPHRGRLWIHAASKQPSDDEVKALQDFYRIHHKREIAFPPLLPTSCLVGCVDVVDVLPQEEYRQKYPDGESNSPYVFVCENPQELMIKFPMSGQHKIYSLDSKLHGAARKSPKKTCQFGGV